MYSDGRGHGKTQSKGNIYKSFNRSSEKPCRLGRDSLGGLVETRKNLDRDETDQGKYPHGRVYCLCSVIVVIKSEVQSPYPLSGDNNLLDKSFMYGKHGRAPPTEISMSFIRLERVYGPVESGECARSSPTSLTIRYSREAYES